VECYTSGLRRDIRAAVGLHRPEDVDTASCLALLQEAELAHDQGTSSASTKSLRHQHKQSSYGDKTKQSSGTDDSRKMAEKLEALCNYRKAKNLCFTCGDPWARGHKCPDKVPIHVMEELLEVLQLDDPPDLQHLSDSSSDEEVMLMSATLQTETRVKRRTMRLHGMIGKRRILILVDSGANCSFVDAKLVADLRLTPQEMAPAQYVVAGGSTLTSPQWIPKLVWWTQGHTFQQDVKVLPLGCYDLIVGADWLEEHSPMWIHWRNRTMHFTHEGRLHQGK